MVRNRRIGSLVAVCGAVGALALGSQVPAHADAQAQSGDVVGVGSDTVQYVANFLDEGDPNGDAGFNAGVLNRAFSFDATTNANGVAVTTSDGSAPNTVYRGGQGAINPRANDSGSGIAALLADTTNKSVNFARASRLPNQGEESNADGTAEAGLHVYRIATDGLASGTAATTNAPASLSVNQLLSVYNCSITNWSGFSGGKSGTIAPYLPQTSSGTYKTFIADLTAANGGTAPTIGSCVTNGVQESDPSVLKGNPNAIVPFSTGRISLINTGYLGSTFANTVSAISGSGSYLDTRGLYIVVRQADLASTKKFEPGSTANFVATLFGSANSFYGAANQSDNYAAAGVNQSYKDCGKDPTSC